MRFPATTAIACAVVVFTTAIGEASASGRGRSGGGGARPAYAHHHHAHTRVFVGGSFFYGPAFYPAPYYYYPAPAYAAPAAPPPVYIQQGQDPATMSWYYCQSARAYYPYVSECPEGWQQVVPDMDTQPAG